MSARSRHLAKLLLQRLAELEKAMLDDADPGKKAGEAARQRLVTKVLLAELGTTDYALSQLVLTAMPQVVPGREPTTRELEEFSGFLEAQLGKLPAE